METTQQGSILNVSEKIPKAKNPFVKTKRLVFNHEWKNLLDEYDKMGMDIPESCDIPKYLKLPFSLNCKMRFNYFKDRELPECTWVEFEGMEHLLDIRYEELESKILEIYEG